MLALTFVERIVEWVQPVFVSAGYFIVAGAVLAERSIFVGLIIPGDLILALGGVYSSQGRMSLPVVIVIGIVAAVTGESIGFWLGRRYGVALVRRLPLVNRLEPQLDKAHEYFERRGGWTVAVGRYATAAGAFIPFAAGISGMRYRKFLLFDVPAIMIWAAGISLFGFVFGENLAFIDRVLSRFGYIMLGLLAAYFGGRWAWKRWKKREG